MSLKIKTYPEIVAEMLTAIGEKTGLTNFNVGSVVRTTTEVFAEVVAELYAFGAGMLKQGFLDTATAFWPASYRSRCPSSRRMQALRTTSAGDPSPG